MSKRISYSENSFSVKGKTYTVDWFIDQYINQNKTSAEMGQEIGVCPSSITNISKHFNVVKDVHRIQFHENSFCIDGKEYSLEWFIQNYHNPDCSASQIALGLHIPTSYVWDIVNHYNISHVDYLIFEEDKFIYKGKVVLVEKVKEVYFQECLNLRESAKKLKISRDALGQVLKHYDLVKTKAQREEGRRKTTLRKYGKEYLLQVPEMKERRTKTCQDHWGDPSPMASDKWKDKRRQEGKPPCPTQNHVLHFDEWADNDKFISLLQSRKESAFYWGEYFNVDPAAVRKKVTNLNQPELLKRLGCASRYEDELVEFLISICGISRSQIKRHVRKGIFKDKREVDILLPDYHLGIEFNGNFFHSSVIARFQDHQGRSRTHQQKSLDALKAGVFIFQIFEYEWNDSVKKALIKDRLKNLLGIYTCKIGARKCENVILSKKEKKDFLCQNHIQGNDHSSVALGLKFEGEIVACMSFVRPRNKKYNWELSRFCCKRGCLVQGAASKLLKYFENNYAHNGEKIVSYNDITKTKGTLYQILGFSSVSINPPNYIWINFKTGDIKTRYQTQQGGEVARLSELGYARICDCGTQTWVRIVGNGSNVKGGDANNGQERVS